ncbi:hypothetical protein [Erwinia amylovora]
MCIRDSYSPSLYWRNQRSVSYTHLDVYKRQITIRSDVRLQLKHSI